MFRDGELDRSIEAFLRGDPEIVTGIRAAIRAIVRSFRFRDPALLKDLTQDSLEGVFLALSAGQFRGASSLETYARNVAKYTCLRHLRRQRFRGEVDPERLAEDGRASGPEEDLLRREEHRRNLKVLAQLPAESRELLRLIFLEGLSYRETAERLGISEGAVKVRVHRCRLVSRKATTRDAGADPSPATAPLFRRHRRAEE